jgi:hypothetical protein
MANAIAIKAATNIPPQPVHRVPPQLAASFIEALETLPDGFEGQFKQVLRECDD